MSDPPPTDPLLIDSLLIDSLRGPIDQAALAARFGHGWHFSVLAETGSTNADLLAAAAGGAPERTVLVAELQTEGRGRLGRGWSSPAGAGLTFSLLLRPSARPDRWGWLPLLAGLALRAAVGGEASLKWPNDLLLGPDGGKVAGILVQAEAGAVVVGIGLNVSTKPTELPVPSATSLVLQGQSAPDRRQLLTDFLTAFNDRYLRWQDAGGDAEATGLAASYRAACATLGQLVSIQLPAGTVTGSAIEVDSAGRLVLQPAGGGQPLAIAAGDVTHVRPISR